MEKCKSCGGGFVVSLSQPGLKRLFCSHKCAKKHAAKERRIRNRQKPDRFFVYALLENNKPFYVGKGSGERINLSKRRHLLPDGTKPEAIKLKTNLLEEDALRYERYYINVLGRRKDGGLLINHNTLDRRTSNNRL